MNRHSNIKIVFFSLICSLLTAGCATTPKIPIKLDPGYREKNISAIYLMPVVDRRIDKKGAIDPEKDIRLPSKAILEKKGYQVVLNADFKDGQSFTGEQLSEMETGDLAGLGPKEAKALLFIYLDDVLDSYAVITYNCKIEMTGSLIGKEEKIEWWRDKGVGESGQAGLISGVFAGMDKNQAIQNALYGLFAGLPDRKPSEQSVSKVSAESPISAASASKSVMVTQQTS